MIHACIKIKNNIISFFFLYITLFNQNYHLSNKSLISQLTKELILIQIPIFITIRLLNKLQNIIITNVNIQILIKHPLNIIQSNQSSLLPIKQSKQIKRLLFTTLTIKPFLCYHLHHVAQRKCLFVLKLV
jgi:hypothetical protein